MVAVCSGCLDLNAIAAAIGGFMNKLAVRFALVGVVGLLGALAFPAAVFASNTCQATLTINGGAPAVLGSLAVPEGSASSGSPGPGLCHAFARKAFLASNLSNPARLCNGREGTFILKGLDHYSNWTNPGRNRVIKTTITCSKVITTSFVGRETARDLTLAVE